MILPRGGFSGLFGALEYKKPRHTLQIVCHSFQDILCMRSLKPSVAIVPAFAHPTSFRVHPWFATFELILISLLLGLLFFRAQVLSVVCHFDEDTPIGGMRAIHNARI